jgi:hypothetical protein
MRPLPHKSFGSDPPHPRYAAKAEKPGRGVLQPQYLIHRGRQAGYYDLLSLAYPSRARFIQPNERQMSDRLGEPHESQRYALTSALLDGGEIDHLR